MNPVLAEACATADTWPEVVGIAFLVAGAVAAFYIWARWVR